MPNVFQPTDLLVPVDMPETRSDLLSLQAARLRRTVERAFNSIPFYQRKSKAAGLSAADVTSQSDLSKIPLTTKEELRKSEAAKPPFGDYRGADVSRCVRISTSSGATGRPTINLMTAHDAELEYLLMGRTLRRNGLRPGDISVNTHPGYLYGGSEFMAAYHAAFGMMSLGLGPLGTDDEVDRHLSLLFDLQPRVAVLFPPSLLRLRKIALERQSRTFPVDYGIEVMSINEFGLQFPSTRRWFEEQLSTKLFTNFGFSEIYSGSGASCREGNGNHINEDFVIVEVIDQETKQALPDGEIGLAVVTSLEKENPLLRYVVGDVGFIDATPCPCGEPSRRFFRLGRASDVVEVGGRRITNADVINALADIRGLTVGILGYQVVVPAEPPVDRLEIVVPSSSEREPVIADAANIIAERLGVPVSLRQEAGSDSSYKPVRVVRV